MNEHPEYALTIQDMVEAWREFVEHLPDDNPSKKKWLKWKVRGEREQERLQKSGQEVDS